MDVINNLFDKYGVYFFFGLLALNLAVLAWVFILRRNFKKIFSMKLVVNTNRIIAALIKDSSTRRIITHLNAELFIIPYSEKEI